LRQVDNKLNRLISAIYPETQETATAELFQLQLIVRHIPRRQLVDIVKTYVHHGSEELNKKGFVFRRTTFCYWVIDKV
jgi:hypothetical protein